MIVVVLPFFWPVLVELNGGEDVAAAAAAYGLGNEELKVWFGILALVVVELGLVTPPVGLNLFIIGSLAPNVPMRETVRGVLPFLACEGVRILLLLAFPLLTLGLPRLLGR
jgi:TRAP-type C4-dicarboxylate transport system permease large subunit